MQFQPLENKYRFPAKPVSIGNRRTYRVLDGRRKAGAEKTPLRICLLSYRSNPHSGGQGVYIRNLSRALVDLGHKVDVVSGPPNPCIDDDVPVFHLPGLDLYNPENLFRVPGLRELCDPVNLVEWLGVSTMGFPEPFTFGMRAHKFLRNRFDKYDIVHDNQSLSYGLLAIRKYLPTIVTIHHPITVDRDIAVMAQKNPLKKLKQMRWYSFIGMQKRVFRKLSNFITVSQCAGHDIRHAFNIQGQRMSVIPNGIDTEIFHPLPGITRDKGRIIVTNSADIPLKGLYYLLKAVAQVSKTHDIKLTVIGTPKKNGKIVKLIKGLDIGRRITFTGRVDSLEYLCHYAKASIAVVPSLYEGFGLPAGEAMACGLPVISTSGGALPEVLGNTGVIVPPADVGALANAILDLLDNPERTKAIGEAGYLRVHNEFTWKKAAEKTVAAYRETIRDHC